MKEIVNRLTIVDKEARERSRMMGRRTGQTRRINKAMDEYEKGEGV